MPCLKYPDDRRFWNAGHSELGRRLRYPGLGTLASGNPGTQAIGSWARQEAQVSWLRYPDCRKSWNTATGSRARQEVVPRLPEILERRLLGSGLGRRLRYPGLGTLTAGNPETQAIGSWAWQEAWVPLA